MRNLSIKAKLIITVGVILLFVWGVGGLGLFGVFRMGESVDAMTRTALPATELLLTIDRDMQQALVALHTA